MNLADALAIFGLAAVPEQDALQLRYRELTKTAHPDAGGSVEAMNTLVSAKLLLEQRAPGTTADADRPRCALCKGRGKIPVTAFITRECPKCEGTGFASPNMLSDEAPHKAARPSGFKKG